VNSSAGVAKSTFLTTSFSFAKCQTICLVCINFHFRSMRISVISKVTRGNKATKVMDSTTSGGTNLILYLEFHPIISTKLKFPARTV